MESKILEGLKRGFISSNYDCEEKYNPSILINDVNNNLKVSTSLISELKQCDEFLFVSAFLTESGFYILRKSFEDLKARNIKGVLIVSQYQYFTEPKALRKILEYKNIELRIVPIERGNLHSKGYIFKKKDEYTIIVGSSNLTDSALTRNIEWNTRLTSSKDGSYFKSVLDKFNNIAINSIVVDEKWIDEYETKYNEQEFARSQFIIANNKIAVLKPNKMQINALEQIQKVRDMKEDRTLIISSTGTGKTYLAAFDVQRFKPKRFLFLVHREKIAKDARDSFLRIMPTISCGLATRGNYSDADYVFAMVQTISKENILNKYSKDYFDYIVVDEAHRSAAASYQKVLNYFTPKFWLGMTATPERTDNPIKIYEIFHHNVAYEIRLKDAMKEDMVCPFHYYGIADIEIDGHTIDDNTSFNLLTDDRRVKHILTQIAKYGYSGKRVKGLIFTSRKEEARSLSDKFNNLGYDTVALTGEDSEENRESAIKRLEQDDLNNKLDYIFTVDIFNEGIDIPSINQIIMLRPTQSNIIFVQQLGRGLRKKIGKDFLVVIDFIGNYEKNFMIPMALSGSKKYNKDEDRKVVTNGDTVLYGESTITFDKISEKRIFESIDRANYGDSRILKNAYNELKEKLGHIPSIKEYDEMGSVDIMRIISNGTYKDYFNFLNRVDGDYHDEFDSLEKEYIRFISRYYLCGKRPHELEFLKLIILDQSNLLEKFRTLMNKKYLHIYYDNHVEENVVNQMEMKYFTATERNAFNNLSFIRKNNNDYGISEQFKEKLLHNKFKDVLLEIIECGLSRNEKYYTNRYLDTNFILYEKYTYDDVFRLLNWNKNFVSLNVGGYKYDNETNTYPVFVNLNKKENIAETIKYEDEFENPNTFKAITKNSRNLNSSDVRNFLNSKDNKTKVMLFIRKNKDDRESKEFYFLGTTTIEETGYEKTKVGGKEALKIIHHLNTPVRQDLYDYLNS